LDEEEDHMAFLEQKRKQVAHVQAAAEIARESAMALAAAQSRIAQIDELAFGGDAGRPNDNSSASAAAKSLGGGGGVFGTPSRASSGRAVSHPHPLVRVSVDEEWVCDGCGSRSIDVPPGAVSRYQCSQGCDFDLCDSCHGPTSGSAAAPSSASMPYQQPRRSLAPVSAKGPCTPTRPFSESMRRDRDGLPPLTSSLSPEDRRRFGLDDGDGRDGRSAGPSLRGSVAAQPSAPAAAPAPPPWGSSLSAEDRRRFGLDGALAPALEERVAALTPTVASAAGRGGRASVEALAKAPSRDDKVKQKHPEVLWSGPVESSEVSMRRTLDQLAAVGATARIAQLEETEKLLQKLKMNG